MKTKGSVEIASALERGGGDGRELCQECAISVYTHSSGVPL